MPVCRLQGCTQTGDLACALECWELVEQGKIEPAESSYASMVQVYASLGDDKSAMVWFTKLLAHCSDVGIPFSKVSQKVFKRILYGLAIAKGSPDEADAAEEWLERMQRFGCMSREAGLKQMAHSFDMHERREEASCQGEGGRTGRTTRSQTKQRAPKGSKAIA